MHPSADPSAPSKTGPSVPTTNWTIAGHHVRDPRSGVVTTIDLDAPGSGIRLGDAAEPAVDHLLGLDLKPRWRLAEHWTRGSDVTAVYESNDARHLRATAMWRLHPCGGGARGWQAVVSAQTSLLQSDPMLAVTSTLAGRPDDAWLWGSCRDGTVRWQETAGTDATCVLLRRTAGDRESVLVAGHPGEIRRIEACRSDGRITIACWLFATTLEKGVLLRSRVLAAVGPAQGDESWATVAATAFAALPPMLTT